MQTTKLYENASPNTIVIKELGNHEVKAGDRVSVTSEFQTPINTLNYPGLVDVAGLTADEHEAALETARQAYKAANPSAKVNLSSATTSQGSLTIQKNDEEPTNAS